MTNVSTIVAALILASALPVARAAELSRPEESVIPVVVRPIPNIPGKTLTSVIVDYPPGAASRSHRHAESALVYAYVLSGSIRSQVDAEAPRIYRTGEFFIEVPGAHHAVSANVSATRPARMLVVFVADAGARLTTPDAN